MEVDSANSLPQSSYICTYSWFINCIVFKNIIFLPVNATTKSPLCHHFTNKWGSQISWHRHVEVRFSVFWNRFQVAAAGFHPICYKMEDALPEGHKSQVRPRGAGVCSRQELFITRQELLVTKKNIFTRSGHVLYCSCRAIIVRTIIKRAHQKSPSPLVLLRYFRTPYFLFKISWFSLATPIHCSSDFKDHFITIFKKPFVWYVVFKLNI